MNTNYQSYSLILNNLQNICNVYEKIFFRLILIFAIRLIKQLHYKWVYEDKGQNLYI